MPEPTAAFCISCGKPVEGDWCPEPCHTDLRDSNNRVTCRRKHGVCNCPDCCEVRRSRATDPSLSDIPLHIRIAEDVRNARSAAQDHGLEDWSNYPNPRKGDLLTPDESEIEVVSDESRDVWTKQKPTGYSREDYERDKKARERRGS